MPGEGGLSSVRDLIEVMTELEHSSEVILPAQTKQRNLQISVEDLDTGKRRLSPKFLETVSEEPVLLSEGKQQVQSVNKQLILEDEIMTKPVSASETKLLKNEVSHTNHQRLMTSKLGQKSPIKTTRQYTKLELRRQNIASNKQNQMILSDGV